MIPKINKRFKSVLPYNSLRIQLLYRSLIILAVLLILIGLFQYVFMRDFIYKNKASSIESQIMSIPPKTWLELIIDPENGNLSRAVFFIPGANLAFIDVHGNYFALSNGPPEGLNPPKLDTKTYLQALKKRDRG